MILGGIRRASRGSRAKAAAFVWVGALAIFAAAAAASPASATVGEAFDLSAPGLNASAGDVAVVESTGAAVFVWLRFDGANMRVETRSRSAAGTLSAVQTLSSAGQDADVPRVAVDADGDAVFTWARFDGENWRAQARARSAAGTLSPVQDLSAAGQNALDQNCQECFGPRVGVDSAGNAVFVWQRFDGTNKRIETRARSAAGVYSAVQSVSEPGRSAIEPRVAVDADGDAVFAWARYDGSNFRIQTRARNPAGSLSAVQNLSDAGENAYHPEVDVNPAGNAVYSWQRFDDTDFRVQARARTAGGALSGVQTLSAVADNATDAHVGVDSAGNAVFVWVGVDGRNQRIFGRARTAAGALSPAQTLAVGVSDADVAVGSGGEAVFSWANTVCGFDCSSAPEVRARSAAGVLSSVQNLAGAGSDPEVAVDASGRAAATWAIFDGEQAFVQGATGPAEGTFGDPVNASPSGRVAALPRVGVDAAGAAVLTWTKGVVDPDTNDVTDLGVQARARSAAGVLSPVQDLSPGGGDALESDVAVADSTGAAVFVWRRFDGSAWRIEARARSATGTLSPVQALSDAGSDAFAPRVAVDANGDAVFTWVLQGETNGRVQARARSASGVLSPVQTLSAPDGTTVDEDCGCRGPELDVDADGDAVFVWRRFNGTNWRIETRARSAAGVLSGVQMLSAAGGDADGHQVAVDSDGDAVFVWRRDTVTNVGTHSRAQARTRTKAGTLGSLRNLFSGDGNNSIAEEFDPKVAVDDDGDAILAWELFQPASPNQFILMRTLSAGGVLGSAELVSATFDSASSPDVGMDSDGDAVFTWLAGEPFASSFHTVHARERSSTGVMGSVETVAMPEDPGELALTVGSGGDAATAWTAFNNESNRRVQVATSP